jgi:CHAT domain-containing protein
LPNASRELESLQKLLDGEGRSVQMLAGESATKRNVLAALPGAEAIHLATHGFSLDATCAGEPDSRSIVIASDERPSPEAQTMTLSGLAFTGASAAKRIDPSGILSAEEFASLDLSHAGWVVLSACDSGLGPIGRSEGVFGMRRAIRMAGARTVVMSLWEVDDASTADLMQALYRARFAEHADVPGAMASAMKATLAQRRAAGISIHPYYWAAFISEGGWR